MRLLRGLNRLYGGDPNRGYRPFRRTLSFSEWWQSYLESAVGQIQLPAGKWTRVGEYIIRPQEQIYFGYGEEQYPENQGYMFLQFYDTTATAAVIIEGLVRLRQMDANETDIEVVFEGRTEVLRGDPNYRQRMQPLPIQDHIPEHLTLEDCKLTIELKSDKATTLARAPVGATNIWNIPVSVYQV